MDPSCGFSARPSRTRSSRARRELPAVPSQADPKRLTRADRRLHNLLTYCHVHEHGAAVRQAEKRALAILACDDLRRRIFHRHLDRDIRNEGHHVGFETRAVSAHWNASRKKLRTRSSTAAPRRCTCACQATSGKAAAGRVSLWTPIAAGAGKGPILAHSSASPMAPHRVHEKHSPEY